MAEIASAFVRVGADVKDFNRGMDQVQGRVNGFQGALVGMGKVVAGATAAAAAGFVALGASGVAAATNFESAFTGVIKTVDATEAELAGLRQGILDMSSEMPDSAANIAGVAEAAGQLGIEVPNILGFTRVMSDLGVTTNMSSTDAATSLARLANITGMSQTDFDRLGSSIVALGNNLATTEGEVVEMAMRLAGAGSQIGLTEAQILGISGALSSVGIAAEAGGTAMSRVMIDMAQAVSAGGEKLNALAEVAGMSAGQFADAFKNDAAGALQAFVKGLDNVGKSGGDLFGVLERLGMDDIRVRDTLMRAAGASGVFADALDISTTAWEENTALTKEAELRYSTIESKMRLFRNAVDAVRIGIGDKLLPVVGEFTEWATDMVKQHGPAVVDFFGRFAERLTAGIGRIRDMLDRLRGAFGLNFAILGSENSSFGEKLLAIWDMLYTVGMKIWQSLLDGLLKMVPKWLDNLWEWAKGLWQWIVDATPEAIAALWEWAKGLWGWLVENLPTWAANLWEWAKATWQWIVDVTPEAVAKLGEWGLALWNWLTTNLPTWIKTLGAWAVAAWQWIVDVTPTVVEKLGAWATALWRWLVDVTPTVVAKLAEWGAALWNWLTTNLPVWAAQLATWGAAIWQWIVEATQPAVDKLIELRDALVMQLTTWASALGPEVSLVWNAIQSIFRAGALLLQGEWSGAWNKIKEAAASVWLALELALQPLDAALRAFTNDFVTWKDVLIGAAATLAILFAPVIVKALAAALAPLVGFVAAWAPVLALFAAAVLAAVVLRNAWENDWGGIKTNTLDALQVLSDAFAPLLTTIQQFGLDALGEIWAWVTGNETNFAAVKAIWQSAQTAFGTVFDAIIAKLEEWGGIAWTWFSETFPGAAKTLIAAVHSIKENWNALWMALEPLIQKIKDAWASLVTNWGADSKNLTTATDRMRAMLDGIFKTIVTIVSGAINGILIALRLVVQLIDGDWEGAWKSAKDLVKNSIDTAKNAVTSAFSVILAAFGKNLGDVERWVGDIKRKFDELVNKFKEFGRDLVDGLKKGIEEKWNGFKNWLNGIWNQLTRTFTLKFDTKSPSGVFKEYGGDLMEGLALGIQRGQNMVYGAMDGLDPNLMVSGLGAGTSSPTVSTSRIEELLTILIQELRNKNMSVNIAGGGGDNYGGMVGLTAAGAR